MIILTTTITIAALKVGGALRAQARLEYNNNNNNNIHINAINNMV